MRDEDLPDPRQDSQDDEIDAALRGDGDDEFEAQSLTDEVAALIDDGKTYVEAELSFQKTRAAYTAKRGKSALLLGLFALGFVHLALVALVVGAVIALTPYVTAWGATAIVVGLLLLGTFILLMLMRNHTRAIGDAFREENE